MFAASSTLMPMENFETFEQLLRNLPEFGLKFLVTILCGGALGMERETTGKPAGLRTSILVCLGSMLFTEMSFQMSEVYGGDSTRIAAQIVTGIGFLGAGVILHEREGGVKGVTTAAMIWLLAALGVMIGAGYILSGMLITTATVVMILVLRKLEIGIHRRRAREYSFFIHDDDESRQRITSLLGFYDENVSHISFGRGKDNEVTLTFRFSGPNSERRQLMSGLYQVKGLRKMESKLDDEQV